MWVVNETDKDFTKLVLSCKIWILVYFLRNKRRKTVGLMDKRVIFSLGHLATSRAKLMCKLYAMSLTKRMLIRIKQAQLIECL